MECHICKQCLQNCVEPCLGNDWKKSTKENPRNPSRSCIPCKSGRLIKCSICRTDLDMSNQEIQKLPFEDMMKYLQIAHTKQKQIYVSQSSYESPKNSPSNSTSNSPKYSPKNSPKNSPKCQTIQEYERHDLSSQEIQKLSFKDIMKYFQMAYKKSVSQSLKISPPNSTSNSPKYSPVMGARKFITNCFSSPKNSPNNSPKYSRNPLQTIQEYERHDLVLYNVNNKYTCRV